MAPEASSAPAKEAPKKRTRRRRTKKPVEDIVVKGPEAEQLLAKEAAAVEAEAAGEAVAAEVATEQPPVAAETDAVANEPQAEALLAEKGDAAEVAPEVAEEPAAESAAAEPADAPAAEATAEPAADEQSNGRSGGRARVRGRGRRGLERRSRGDNLSDVPYVRRGGESETALREQIVQLDPRLWMNGCCSRTPAPSPSTSASCAALTRRSRRASFRETSRVVSWRTRWAATRSSLSTARTATSFCGAMGRRRSSSPALVPRPTCSTMCRVAARA